MQSDSFKQSTTIRRWPYLLACIISSILMVWAAIWSYAEIITITPRQNINHWEKTGIINNPHAAKESWGRLQKAVILNSGNAEFYMDLARLAKLQSNASQISDQNKEQLQEQTIQNLKSALGKRPSWGLAWAKLAQTYSSDPEHSSDFIHALEHAIYFEPYEKLNQQHIIPLGIAHWDILPEVVKNELIDIIKHALRYQPKIIHLIVSITIQNDWTNELSPLLTKKWHQNVLRKAMQKKEQGK